MTNRERLGRVLNGEPVDRILTYDYVDNTDVLRSYGGYFDNRSYSPEELLEVNVRAYEGIGLDVTRATHDPVNHWMQFKVDNWVRFFGVDPGLWTVEQGGETAWISGRPFTDLKGLEKHLPQIPKTEEIREWYGPFIRRVTQAFHARDRVFIGAVEGPICDAYTYTDMELFSLTLYDAPEIIGHLLDCTTEYSRAIASIYAENDTAPLQFMGEDIAGSNGAIFAVDLVKSLCLERWKTIAEPIRERGGKFIFHTDGRYGELLHLLLGGDGLDAEALNPIERAGCNDIFAIHRAWPEKFLLGNVCCEETLPFGNPFDVEDEVLELIEKIGPSGRILIGSSSEVHEKVPLINIETMYGTVHDYGSYPLDIERIQRRRREIAPKRATRKDYSS